MSDDLMKGVRVVIEIVDAGARTYAPEGREDLRRTLRKLQRDPLPLQELRVGTRWAGARYKVQIVDVPEDEEEKQ